jgi:DDE family transposase
MCMGVKESSLPEELALLRTCLKTITDPRHRRGLVHPLEGVLTLSVLGLMAGCRSLSDLHRWGALHQELFEPLGLRRSPSVATLARLLRWISVEQVRAALRTFAQQLLELRGYREELAVAADGKSLRGVWEDGQQLGILHLFAHQAKLALDQVAAPYHVQEVQATRGWIEEVASQFPGLQVLTGDALFADRSLCAAMVAQGQDYLVKLKKTSRPSMKM